MNGSLMPSGGVRRRALLRNALRRSYFPVMVGKVYRRVRSVDESVEARRWAAEQAVDVGDWAAEHDPELWVEAESVVAEMERERQPVVRDLAERGVALGGSAHMALLYFMVRLCAPACVLETGVAAGWSSAAILAGLRDNDAGYLYSSDFPYFRLDEPERHVGVVVPDQLRGRWASLLLDGDRRNLDRLLPNRTFELAHYDSDKSRAGKQLFLRRVTPHLGRGAHLVFDDIDDDLFFRDHFPDGEVFRYGRKYVGLVQLP